MKKYQHLKQEIQKKVLKQQKFWNLKKQFFNKEKSSDDTLSNNTHTKSNMTPVPNPFQNILGITHINTATPKNEYIPKPRETNNTITPTTTSNNIIDTRFQEDQKVMEILIEPISKDMQTTTKMLYELSNLMNNFSLKVHEQQELTTISNIQLINVF